MDKRDIETMVEFFYNRCLRCDYKECKKKKERIEEYETALQKIKNEKLQDIEGLTGIHF